MLAGIGIVLTLLGAENFVLPKKEIIKKKPRITRERIIAGQGESLQDLTQVFKHGVAVQETFINDITLIMNQENKNASQEKMHEYEECMHIIQQASKSYTQLLEENHRKLKNCFKK